MEKQKYFFLLGGHDLEMLEIRKLLEQMGLEEGRDFLDKGLSWGAKLSDYREDFRKDRIHVTIELAEDMSPPENYLRIDHHNELSDRPASIEQIAELLGVELSRHQLLVAANDRGYIPAMQEMGATSAEILEIRRKDRAAQGVTEEDERLAEQSITENLKTIGNVTLVESLTPKFSPITDRLYGIVKDHLIIYTDHALTYYGSGVKALEGKFLDWIKTGKAYTGGGPKGFFGLATNACEPSEIESVIRQIINQVK